MDIFKQGDDKCDQLALATNVNQKVHNEMADNDLQGK